MRDIITCWLCIRRAQLCQCYSNFTQLRRRWLCICMRLRIRAAAREVRLFSFLYHFHVVRISWFYLSYKISMTLKQSHTHSDWLVVGAHIIIKEPKRSCHLFQKEPCDVKSPSLDEREREKSADRAPSNNTHRRLFAIFDSFLWFAQTVLCVIACTRAASLHFAARRYLQARAPRLGALLSPSLFVSINYSGAAF